MPSPTAPTGNYNEDLIRGLRSLYHDLYQDTQYSSTDGKVYISRGKAQRRKITNEEEVIAVMKEFGFETIYFEDHSFEQQAKIAMNARYIVSNHGAGLTNMLFMGSGSSVLELRKRGDAHNNCYFALASALELKYFYQICDPENPGEDAHRANLIVDGKLLRRNIEKMLSN
jgi:capsular polysaccharide biosynthesis protein